jgi:hypothetical protein
MSNAENLPPKKKKLKKWQWAVLIFVVFPIILVLFLPSSSTTTTSTPEATTTTSTPEVATPAESVLDYSATRACSIWLDVLDEGRKGIQTEKEMRAGFKKVYDKAKSSDIPQIVDAATRMLSSITIYNIDEFEKANNDFGKACSAK